MSSREHVLLEEVSGVHSTLDKCYYSVPSTNTISAEYASWLQPNYNIPIPANKCSFQNNHALLNKSNLPLGQCSVRVFAGTISKQNMKYSLKSCTHFQISNPPFKGAVPLLEKSTCLHNICSIIDIEHRFQKCDINMFETVSSIKECSFASDHRTTEYCPVLQKKESCEEAAFLENWIAFVWHVYSSPWSGQPSLHLDNSHLKKCFQYNPTIIFLFNQISHSYQGGIAQIQQQILQGRPYSFKRVLHAYSIPYVQTMFDCLKT